MGRCRKVLEEYLLGQKCIVRLDNDPLIFKQPNWEQLNTGGLQNWHIFDLEIRYKPGRTNINADAWQNGSSEQIVALAGALILSEELRCAVQKQHLALTSNLCIPGSNSVHLGSWN